MTKRIQRRRFLQSSATLAASSFFVNPSFSAQQPRQRRVILPLAQLETARVILDWRAVCASSPRMSNVAIVISTIATMSVFAMPNNCTALPMVAKAIIAQTQPALPQSDSARGLRGL